MPIAASRLVPQARCRSRPGVSGEAAAEHALAHEVPLARVLHDRAGLHVAEALALQPKRSTTPLSAAVSISWLPTSK
jgi:hypothetical protein